ncbi:unnamed protein product [Microthlaspi erraticum]|uniref:F-box associated beta-propeller type 3 domain-containing protein n=1 Tax=Microthlaspi erraticum TaxID=1685480 RepID=A0A6D2K0A1_9BRAS|nr:unnamed protein product [Microthlaspi erraticum]
MILCVDVTAEEFKLIDAECLCDMYRVKLVNYTGRLCGISWGYDDWFGKTLELCMCVLEDVETQEWSKSVYSLGEKAPVCPWNDYVVGVTAADHVEDIDANDANQQLSRPVKEGLEIIRERPEPPKQQQKPQIQHTSSDLGKSDLYVKNKQPTILLQNKYELLAHDIE